VGFLPEIQGWFHIHKSLYVIQHIIRSKDKNHMIISTDTEKAFDKIQHSFKRGIAGMYLNVIKAIYDKPISNITVNRVNLKTFTLKSGMRQDSPFSLLFFNVVLSS
jgi:hypothetical protein